MAKKQREAPKINDGAMADIAFLLLIFFLVTSTIVSDKGIAVVLPPKADSQQVKIKERNIFNILVNSQDMILADDERVELDELSDKVKKFVLNNGKSSNSSESPQKAIVSFKTDRGTSYEMYIQVRDELKLAYDEMRAAYLRMPLEDYEALDPEDPEQKKRIDRAKKAIPAQVSDAEPSDIGG